MNKQQLVAKIAEVTETTKKDADAFVSAFVDVVTDELSQGGKISIMGFGVFETRERAAREGRNPQTGEALKIPASVVPAFKAGKGLKEAVKNG